MWSQETDMKQGKEDRKAGVRVGCPGTHWCSVTLDTDLLAASLRNVLPSRRVSSRISCNRHPLLTNGCFWLYHQLLVQLSMSLCCQRNHQTETTMMVLKISYPTGNFPSYLWVHSSGFRWSCKASSSTDYPILLDGTIGGWTFEVPSLSWLAFLEHCPYPKYPCVSGALILVLCHLTFLSTSARAVPFHLVFCMQFPLCSSPFCHACLPQSRQNGSSKAHPQLHLSIPLAFALVVAFRTKSLSYMSVCKAQLGRPPPQYSGQVGQALVAMGWFL